MPFVCPNNVQETSTTTGTGPVTLLGPVSDARDFDSQLADADTTPYTIKMGADEEYGIGTFTVSGLTLTRTTVLGGTNGTSPVSFGSGTKNVYAALPGELVASLISPDGTTGFVARTAAQTYARRTLTAGAGIGVTNGDGVAGDPTVATTFTSPGVGAVPRNMQARMESTIDALDFSVTGVPATTTVAEIQAAIDHAETIPGAQVDFVPGAWDLGSTGITILGDGIVLQGNAPRFVGASLFGTEFLYSGTGTAVAFGSAAKTVHYRNGFHDIQIRATGAAIASASAIGLKTYNQHYFDSERAAIKDFSSGIGLQMASGNGGFGASSQFRSILVHQCNIGVDIDGDSLPEAQNNSHFWGGAIIGFSAPIPAGSVGINIGLYADAINFYGTDIESFETGVEYAGRECAFIATRGEFCTNEQIHINSTALGIQIVHHAFVSVVTEAGRVVDDTDGQLVFRFDRYRFSKVPPIYPNTDGGQIFHVLKADGTTIVFNVSTNLTPQVTFPNSVQLVGYSDNYATQTWIADGSTGEIQANVFTGRGTPIALGSAGVSIGGDTSATVGATGAAAVLPAAPLGYIDAYVGATAVKIPYYNN